jgi:cation diffusion facilitator family transporter
VLVDAMPQMDRLTRVAVTSIAVAVVVMAIKYLAYQRTGSVALYSDALESIVNVITAAAAVLAIQISDRPADRHHQYGHHKAEYFAAVIEGTLIIVAAILILREAIAAIYAPRSISHAFEGMAIAGVAALINAGWSWWLLRCGRAWRSPALIADGWHVFSDVLTSVGVLAGLGLAAVTGIQMLDPLLASLVAMHILWIGWRLMRVSASSLMDEAVPAETASEIQRVITANAAGAMQVHDIRTRLAGRATFIELHLVVPGAMTVEVSHTICDRIEDALEAAIEGAQVLIHVEPEHKAEKGNVLRL